jgi:hypothetical protein
VCFDFTNWTITFEGQNITPMTAIAIEETLGIRAAEIKKAALISITNYDSKHCNCFIKITEWRLRLHV